MLTIRLRFLIHIPITTQRAIIKHIFPDLIWPTFCRCIYWADLSISSGLFGRLPTTHHRLITKIILILFYKQVSCVCENIRIEWVKGALLLVNIHGRFQRSGIITYRVCVPVKLIHFRFCSFRPPFCEGFVWHLKWIISVKKRVSHIIISHKLSQNFP